VVFKEGFRSRSYCLSECTQVNLSTYVTCLFHSLTLQQLVGKGLFVPSAGSFFYSMYGFLFVKRTVCHILSLLLPIPHAHLQVCALEINAADKQK